MANSDYVQYGCGLYAPSAWRNFDVSPTLRIKQIPLLGRYLAQRGRIPDWPSNVEYGDIVRGLPIQSDSCQGIYCSHVLEHLALEDLRTALKNTYRYLKPGGIFRFVLPDLEFYIDEYIQSEAVDAAHTFMKQTLLGKETRTRGIGGFAGVLFGNSYHLWMWDYRAMSHELKNIGFVGIRRAEFSDSHDPMFKAVDEAGRWKNCLGIECKKSST